MPARGSDGLYASTAGIVQEGRGYDCPHIGLEESLAKRTGIRNADAHVFHQPRWQGAERKSESRAGACEEDVVGENSAGQREEGRLICLRIRCIGITSAEAELPI
jgi:hypothetical protein